MSKTARNKSVTLELKISHKLAVTCDTNVTVITYKILKSYMGFCIFLITEDLSFRLFGLKLSTRSQTSGGSRAGARGTRPLPPSNFRPKEEDWGGVRVKLVAWKCVDGASLVLTCDQAFVLTPSLLLWEARGLSLSPERKKNLIAGYIVYESIQFSDAGAAENLNTSLTKQPTISSPTIQFSS